MIFSVDTSTLVAFFSGSDGEDIQQLQDALTSGLLLLTPVVVSEILSDPKLPSKTHDIILSLPRTDTKDGLWERVGYLRRSILKKKQKARLADSLIAQYCLDYNLTLITRDSDFKNFSKLADLKISGII